MVNCTYWNMIRFKFNTTVEQSSCLQNEATLSMWFWPVKPNTIASYYFVNLPVVSLFTCINICVVLNMNTPRFSFDLYFFS